MSRRFWSLLTFSACVLSAASASVHGQGPGTSDDQKVTEEIAVLREQLRSQHSEIEKLRSEIANEIELRKTQQDLLEKLIEKFNKLGIALAGNAAGASSGSHVNAPEKPAEDGPSLAASKVASSAKPSGASPQTTTANSVESGFGKVKFTGLIQGWFAAGDQGFNDTFRIRRAELRFTGDLMPHVRWSVMFDPAKALSLNTTTATVGGIPVVRTAGVNQASRIFQEAYITLTHLKRANLQFGQFKIPLSQEGLQSSGALDTVERALFLTDRARGGGLGDTRDTGVMVFGPVSDQLDYQFGIFNGVGESQNDVDQNEQKAAVGRLVFRPAFLKGLQIGGSGALGFGSSSSTLQRNRLGAELLYSRRKFKFKTELMTGTDGAIHRRGYYVHVGYRFIPKVEAIFRFDEFDPDIRNEGSVLSATERDYIAGINYFIKDHNLKLQFNYVRKTFTEPATPSRNQFLVNLQTSW